MILAQFEVQAIDFRPEYRRPIVGAAPTPIASCFGGVPFIKHNVGLPKVSGFHLLSRNGQNTTTLANAPWERGQ